MNRANQYRDAASGWKNSTKWIMCVAVLALVAGRTIGDELCARTDGSSVEDKATGSVMMAGAVVIGASFDRTGVAFSTHPSDCGEWSDSADYFPDCDKDDLITLADFQCLYECLAGPDIAAERNCLLFDMDESGTVDAKDLRNFQNRFGTSLGG